ncbi:MAG TPA: hydrogenase iron-sulfur subunit, partial [Burkholderiaceae bacterium]|nr:hydrogenase iron-sulfur subunit [Burkholderiaceae bacterium]
DRCAACGICAGACPSANPFRRGDRLVSGIDLPWLTVARLRDEFEAALARWQAARTSAPVGPAEAGPLAVVCCRHGAGLGASAPPGVLALGLPCAGLLPPTFVDYALRTGARGIIVAVCPTQDCEFRFGASWTALRMTGQREPRLRTGVERARLRVIHAAREDRQALLAAVADFDAAPIPEKVDAC